MKSVYQFEAQTRENTGRGAARAIRREGKVPAVMYSKKIEPLSFTLTEKTLVKEYNKGSFTSKLVEITLDGKKYFALPCDIQTNPVSDRIEHADFLQVDADSKIHVHVPVKIRNMDRSIGLKRGGALNIVRHTVELICSPENIPSRIEVDVKDAEIGDSIHISAVTLPEGVVPAIQDRDFTLVTIAGRKKEEEAKPAEGAEVEATADAKAAAAKAPAAKAGEAKPAEKK